MPAPAHLAGRARPGTLGRPSAHGRSGTPIRGAGGGRSVTGARRRLLVAAGAAGAAVMLAGGPVAAVAGAASPAAGPVRASGASLALSARAAILIEPDTGEVAYARAPDTPTPIASTTKLMTALVTLERAPLDRLVSVAAYPAGTDESIIGLGQGERLSVADLMRAMLLASANNAAYTLAVRVAGSEAAFVADMNARAAALGLHRTHYATPVGLDVAGNYSTPADLARLAEIDLRNPFFAATVALPSARLTTGAYPRVVINRNDLVGRYRYVDGVKTGHTLEAGYVLVAAAHRSGVRLLSVVIGDPSLAARDADTLTLLRFGLEHYRLVRVLRAGQALAQASVRYAGGRVALVARRGLRSVLALGSRPTVTVSGTPARLSGPLIAGAPEGWVEVHAGGRLLGRIELVSARSLPRPSLGARLRDYLSNPLTVVLLGALIGCSLLLVMLRRRAVRLGRGRAPTDGRGAPADVRAAQPDGRAPRPDVRAQPDGRGSGPPDGG